MKERKNKTARTRLRSTFTDYLLAFVAVAGVCGACLPVSGFIGYQAVGLIFLIVIAVLSLFLGRGAIFFAAILSSASWNFFFISPLYTFQIHRIQDVISVVANLMVALVGATLITRIRKSRIGLERSRERISMLNSFLESLNTATSIKAVVSLTQENFRKYFNAEIVIYLKEKHGENLSSRAFGNPAHFPSDSFDAARRVFQSSGIETEPFHLLKEPRGHFGVMGVYYLGEPCPDEETCQLVTAFISHVASALEREISVDLAKEKDLVTESEKLFQTILNSVSHEMRTPIAIMSSAISNLNDPKTSAKPEMRKQIITELEDAVKRMNYLVANILDMSRIESGHLKLNLQICELGDVAGHVVHLLRNETRGHVVEIHADDGVNVIRGDVSLLNQALVNVLHNAVQYTPAGSTIRIGIRNLDEEHVGLSVVDNGPGVPGSMLEQVFGKFYRVPGSPSGGTGLGLTITKAIIEAHRGAIFAESTPGCGFQINMIFPAELSDGSE